MKKIIDVYDFDALQRLMKYFYSLGWYYGKKDLLTITMQGGFEAFSGRASETWEHIFVVSNCEIPDLNIKAHTIVGQRFETLNYVCKRLINELENDGIKNLS